MPRESADYRGLRKQSREGGSIGGVRVVNSGVVGVMASWGSNKELSKLWELFEK